MRSCSEFEARARVGTVAACRSLSVGLRHSEAVRGGSDKQPRGTRGDYPGDISNICGNTCLFGELFNDKR